MAETIMYKMKAKVKFGNTVASVTDVGTVEGLSVTTENENGQISFDYREDTIDYIKKRKGKIGFNLDNINWENIRNFSDTDHFETVDGSEVAGATQTISDAAADTFYKLDGQNGDKSLVVVNSIGSLVEGTDFFVVKDGNGDSGIIFIADQSGALVVNYDYTPAASKVYEYGGGNAVSTISPKVVQVEGVDENGKKITITANYAKLTSGIQIAFPAFSADEKVQIPVEFECTADPDDESIPVLRIVSEM